MKKVYSTILILAIIFSLIIISFSSHSLINKGPYTQITINDTTRDSLNKFYRYTKPGYVIDIGKPKGLINDIGEFFSNEELDTLNMIVRKHEKETTNEIAVVTFDSLPLSQEEFNPFSLGLFNKWGVGQKDKNNGVLIAVCNKNHFIRIQNGYGIEKKLSDSETKEIIDSIMIPEFKKNNFYEGTKKGILAIIKKIT